MLRAEHLATIPSLLIPIPDTVTVTSKAMPRILPRIALAAAAPLFALAPLHAADPPADPFRQAVEAIQKSAHQHAADTAPYFEELERGFRRLQKQFPNQTEIYNELLFVADHSPKDKALRLAGEILDWPAPESTKAKTRGVIAKLEAIGKPWHPALTNIDGRPIDPARWKGKVLLVDFWATWCPPCREGLPELKRIHTLYRPQGLEIVGISFDDNLDTLRRFVAKEQMEWPQVADGQGWEGPMAARFGITSLPTMWLVDRQGRLQEIHARAGLAAKIEALLKETP